jgi:CBS domain containing-hemolysin-like protein
MSSAWFLLGVAGLLIFGNAVFVAAETALVTVDRNLVESRAREGSVRFGRRLGNRPGVPEPAGGPPLYPPTG